MSPTFDLLVLVQLKLLQINLNHFTTANDNAKNYIIENSTDIALLQDTHCNKKGTLISLQKYRATFPSTNIKAHIVVRALNLCIHTSIQA